MNDIRRTFDRNFFVSLSILIIIIGGWYLISPFWQVLKKDENVPQGQILAVGSFVSAISNVKGQALLISAGNKKILHFDNFKTMNGPGLHVYLSFSKDNRHFVDIGKVVATEGSVNYEVPSSVDFRRYTTVLIWSEQFQSLFGYADLH